ncbi:phosphotransferase enzyme family protein [Algoriphagus zhangzhouensis]|uniref:Ser/Thr protein kinase RdoA involved in Cpx stress response, MazF antagonist n=1 Tax=Algoriphagus zhangzhouensis TaxID=1073327 RepID=A0A1M7ZAU7_9BACT|nr:aminoglycoside phosphotransferase family protein [Algoriphagus zhangzhouensis]TDY47000.1 Ser/Thr protein kinase RdoA (MazF antagonist) [Algoriphagus zhangzhouensis]SHO62041.1 Ser/Thr protein kinase RdoA involved in Cpx stress response, MazF antagonist [Algoriphagus zhangzhouensis]
MDLQKIHQILSLYPSLPFQELSSINALGNGLIHDTYRITTADGAYVLQAYNQSVFPFPERIANNLGILIREKVNDQLPYFLPLPLLNLEGKQLTEVDGKSWRIFEFVEGNTLEQITALDQAKNAAFAFAKFSLAGAQLDMGAFQETIPDFHRLDLRYEKFLQEAGKAQNLDEEEQSILLFYVNQKPLIEAYKEFAQKLPVRLTHSDTKINNLIFSKDLSKVEALIDLDTVMPGFLMYDFGDMVRTVACSIPETDTQWEKLCLEEKVFEQLLEGYWSGLKSIATPEEKESLLLAGEVMTCMMGLRFFTDHLMGNVYYRVQYPEQNLHRAKNQMIYLRDLQQKRGTLKALIDQI